MVTMTVVTIVIIARGSSSMVAVMIARRKPIVAAIVSHALVTLWSTIVLASGDMPARTAVGVAACRSTASSRSITATGIVATAAFCNECQLMAGWVIVGGPGWRLLPELLHWLPQSANLAEGDPVARCRSRVSQKKPPSTGASEVGKRRWPLPWPAPKR